MNRVLASILLGSLAATPVVASAQQQFYPTTVWPAAYETLPGNAIPLDLKAANDTTDGRTGQIELDRADGSLPFDITFGGVNYQKMKVGSKGYVTFGASQANVSPSTSVHVAASANTEPRNLLAVWWGDHHCDVAGGDIRALTLGSVATGDHRLVIEWKCSKGVGTGPDSGSTTTFRAQLVIFDLADDAPFGTNNVMRAAYGDVSVDPTAGDWGTISWGQRFTAPLGGQMGPGASGVQVCQPSSGAGKCTSSHFPANTAIQYGHFPTRPDVTAKVEVLGFSLDSTRINVDLKSTFLNTGQVPANGVTYDVYLTSDPESFDLSSAIPIGSRTSAFTVPALASAHVETDFFIANKGNLRNGRYYVCIDIDPAGVVPEADRSNNQVCSFEPVMVGPDLTGTIALTAPVSQAKEMYDFIVTFSNLGTEAAAGFDFTIKVNPVPDPNNPPTTPSNREIYQSTYEQVSGIPGGVLAAGETSPPFTLPVRLPYWLRDEKFVFVLSIDPHRSLVDANRSNNEVVTPTQLTISRPALTLTPQPVDITFPFGCYFGQPMFATYTLCNSGQMDASAFRTGIAISDDSNVNLFHDTPAATFPQYCGAIDNPDSYNRQACKPINGIMPECPYEYCVIRCDPNNDTVCPGMGLKCLYDESWNELETPAEPYYTCQMDIGRNSPNNCKTVTVAGVVPRADMHEVPYPPGGMYFHVIDDIDQLLSQPTPNFYTTDEPIECFESLPDFESPHLNLPERVVAGEPFAVDRSIKNVGFIELPVGAFEPPDMISVEYGYFLSQRRDDISPNQIMAKVKSTNGLGVATVGSKATGTRDEDRRPELIEIPAGINPGIYYIGIVVDPNEQYRELDKNNNVKVFDTPIVVDPPSLTVNGDAPTTVVLGSRVTFQFAAMGSVGTCRWTPESLPPGLLLNLDGLMTGTVTEVGSHAYKIHVTCGDLTATRAYVMQVIDFRGTLAIATNELPPARQGHSYGAWIGPDDVRHEGVQLVAVGGVSPYTWVVIANRPPEGLHLTREGLIIGTPTQLSQTSTFTVQVEDGVGNVARKELTIERVGRDSLSLNRYQLPDGFTAVEYNQICVTVSGGVPDYTWTSSPLPPGFESTTNGASFCVQGVPSKSGNYEVVVTASDSSSQSISKRLPLTVVASELPIVNKALPVVSRGETVEIQLEVGTFQTRPSQQVVFSLIGGSLPDGLTLSQAGVVSGTVSKDAPFGTYNFMVRAEDDQGRIGEKPFAMVVKIEPREPIVEEKTTGGCSSSGGVDLSLLGLALTGFGALRRSRRKTEGAD